MDIDHIFDTQTLFSVYFIIQLVISLFFLVTIPIYNRTCLKWIAAGMLMECLSVILLIFAGLNGMNLLLFISNVIGIAGPWFILYGIIDLMGKKLGSKEFYGIIGIPSVLFIINVFLVPNEDFRILTFFITNIVMILMMFVYVFGIKRKLLKFEVLLMILYLLYAVTLATRTYDILQYDNSNTAFFSNGLQMHLELIYMNVFMVMRALLILLITSEQLQLALMEANTQLEVMSLTDDLTGLLNKRELLARLESEVIRSRRYGTNLAVAMVDFDDFKMINDTQGHVFGDHVLERFSDIAKASVRANDFIARYGGEEFVFVFPEATVVEAREILSRILYEISSEDWAVDNFVTTLSGGIASVHQQKADVSIAHIIEEADNALYLAKRKGKNRIEIY